MALDFISNTTNFETDSNFSEPSLTDRLIHLLATSYVRRENRFFHIDRPHESITREDLQRVFLTPAKMLNGGIPVPSAVMKEVYDTAIRQNNADDIRAIPFGPALSPHTPAIRSGTSS